MKDKQGKVQDESCLHHLGLKLGEKDMSLLHQQISQDI